MRRRATCSEYEVARRAERLNREFERAVKKWSEQKAATEERFENLEAEAYGARRVGNLVSILGTWVAVDQVDTITDHSRRGQAPSRSFFGPDGWDPRFKFGASLPAVTSTVRLRSGEELTFPLTADVIADVLATPEQTKNKAVK